MPVVINGTTGIQLPDGTATNPSIRGTTSANTGLYFPAANTLGFSANSTLEMFVDATGPATNTGQYISAVGMKNRIINGDFKIDQRFSGAANNNLAANSVYVVDRWFHYTGGTAGGPTSNKLRFQQNNTNGPTSAATQLATGFPNFFGCNVVSSNTVGVADQWLMTQAIEGLNISDLGWGTANAHPITVSFWVYSSVPGTHSFTINNLNGARSYPATYTVSAANTWQLRTVTIPGDTSGSWFTNNNVGLYTAFNLGCGTNYATSNPNTWSGTNAYLSSTNGVIQIVTAANGSFYVTGVQVEKGTVSTPFEFRQYEQELALCYRYAWMATSGDGMMGAGNTNGGPSAVFAQQRFQYPVRMRTAPTANVGIAGTWAITDDWSADVTTTGNFSIAGFQSSTTYSRVNITSFTGLTNGRLYAGLPGSGTGAILFTAEL